MRDYDPTTGRFILADPLGLVDGASVYGYAGQNPGRWIDPRGENATVLAPVVCTGPQAAGCVVVAACVTAAIGAYELYNWLATADAPPQMPMPDDGICDQCSMSSFPPGDWPGDSGAAEWGRRNGVGAKEGKRRFHDMKKGNKGSSASEDLGTNPTSGDVVDSNGESIGNLNNED